MTSMFRGRRLRGLKLTDFDSVLDVVVFILWVRSTSRVPEPGKTRRWLFTLTPGDLRRWLFTLKPGDLPLLVTSPVARASGFLLDATFLSFCWRPVAGRKPDAELAGGQNRPMRAAGNKVRVVASLNFAIRIDVHDTSDFLASINEVV